MPIEVARTMPASPAAAWRVLTDTRMWVRWGPSIAAVDADPPVIGPGHVGRLRTPVGIWLPFEVTTYVAGASWGWRVAGVPATGHRVEPTAEGCRIVFEVPWAAAPYVAVCRVALHRLASLLAEADG